ncbi:MAG: hypothetical protein Q4G02_03860 [bacterium]|nr:hypothetical protein [bacterium]
MLKILLLSLFFLWQSSAPSQAQEGMKLRLISSNNNYSTASATIHSNLSLGLQSVQTIPNGQFQILLAATSSAGLGNDGQPDYSAYDIADLVVSCPNNVDGFTFAAPQISTADVSNLQIGNETFHLISCAYTGDGQTNNANFGYSNSNYFQLNNLINPLNNTSQDASQIIFTPVWIRQLDANGEIIYNQVDAVGMSRTVQMSAKVSPHISFTIEGVPESTSACNMALSDTTDATGVNFGFVDEKSFSNAAQKLTVVSNNVDFVVTAIENDQMGLENGQGKAAICPADALAYDNCLPNATVLNMTATQEQPWLNPEDGKGLAFTMENLTGNDNAFSYEQGFRHFADAENQENPVVIMSNLAQTTSVDFICYRLIAKKTNLNGFYHNYITYTLTATF